MQGGRERAVGLAEHRAGVCLSSMAGMLLAVLLAKVSGQQPSHIQGLHGRLPVLRSRPLPSL